MGSSESGASGSGIPGDDCIPSSYVRMNSDRMNDKEILQDSMMPLSIQTPVVNTGFAGRWSISLPNGFAPDPRTGQFTCHSKEHDCVYVGYGTSPQGQGFFDLWAFEFNNYTWRRIPLKGDILKPRNGCRAVIHKNSLLVYGGFIDPDYVDDFHTINVVTGEVTLLQTTGDHPGPRSTPLMIIHENKLFLWGGFNGKWPSSLHILDFATMNWVSSETGVSGRTGIPTAIVNGKLYGYGCSRSGGFVVIDPKSESVSVVRADGTPPPCEVMNAGMVRVQDYLIYFGGKTNTDHTLVYACDIHKMWWFVFHVAPDGETTSLADGSVTENGLFQIPKTHSFGLVYCERKREVLAFLGFPSRDPPLLSILSVGDALSILHLRDDMLDSLGIK